MHFLTVCIPWHFVVVVVVESVSPIWHFCDRIDCSQAPMSVGFPRQEYWSGLPFPSPRGLPSSGIKLTSPTLAGIFFTTELREKPNPDINATKKMPIPVSPWLCFAHLVSLNVSYSVLQTLVKYNVTMLIDFLTWHTMYPMSFDFPSWNNFMAIELFHNTYNPKLDFVFWVKFLASFPKFE